MLNAQTVAVTLRAVEPPFDVKAAQLGGGTFVVSVAGEADMHTAPEIERELEDVLRLGGRSVALDLVEVDFIDSTPCGCCCISNPGFAPAAVIS